MPPRTRAASRFSLRARLRGAAAAPALRFAALVLLLVLAACGRGQPASNTQAPPSSAPSEAVRPTPPVAMRRGLWVLCEGSQRVLDHPDRIGALLAEAKRLRVTDLFVQVYRGGRAWFNSSLVDATPYREARQRSGLDPLATLIARAHAAGLRVHAWVNVLSLASHRHTRILRELGPDAVQVDQRGRSVLDYPHLEVPPPDGLYYRMGTRAVWLDPAAPGVAKRLAAVFTELVTRYPGLDGLHLDYIRYPGALPFAPGSRFGVGLDFGYGRASRARFRADTGLTAPFGSSLANADRWDDWRRERVTELVRRIAEGARRARPGIEISAAVWAYANRAYLSIYQDWRGWLQQGLLDFAVPMAYTRDDRLLHYLAASLTHGVGGKRVWLGLGSWLFAAHPAQAVTQLRIAEHEHPAGISFFSYDSIAESPALERALAAEAQREP